MNKTTLAVSLLAVACNNATPALANAQVCDPTSPATTPISRFKINLDGTVVDTYTGLMWKQCLEGVDACEENVIPSSFSWESALEQADSSNFAGYSDWRLPNIKELTSIIEFKCHEPAINLSIFPDPSINFVWSSSIDPILTSRSWGVFFRIGTTSNQTRRYCGSSCYGGLHTKLGHVLLVRDIK